MKQNILLKKLVLFVLAIASLSVIASAEEPLSQEELPAEMDWVYAEDVDLDVSGWALSDDPVALFELSPYEQMKASVLEQIQQKKTQITVKNLLDEPFSADKLYFNTVYSFPEETAHVEVTKIMCEGSYDSNGVFHAKEYDPGRTIGFKPIYLDEGTYSAADFKAAVDAAETACFRTGMTDLETVVAVHDWLVLNCQYDPYVANGKEDYTAGGVTYTDNRFVYSPYGVFVEGNAVCQGYALAFQAMMNRAEIPCYFVSGQNHAWNVVQLDDAWYYVDATWDDPVNIGEEGDLYGHVGRASFLKGETTFQKTKTESQGGHAACAPWSTEYGTQLNISDHDYVLPAGLANAADVATYLIDDMFYLAEIVKEDGKANYGVLHKYEIGSNFKEGVQVADGLPATIVSAAWDEDSRTLYFLSGLFYNQYEEPRRYYQYLYKYTLDGAENSAEKVLNTTPVTELRQYTLKLSEEENGEKELWTWYDYSKVDTLQTINYYVDVEAGGYSYYQDDDAVLIELAPNTERDVMIVWYGNQNGFLKVDFCTKSDSYTIPEGAVSMKILAVGDMSAWFPLCAAKELNV